MGAARQPGSVTVVVVDDHPEFRRGLREIVDQAPDFAVVGEAPDGAEAIELVKELRPEIVLMDLQMPVMDGSAATAEIVKADPAPSVIVLTASSTSEHMLEAIAAGAAGYLLKGASADEIHGALRATRAGGAPLSPDVAAALVHHVYGQRARESERLSPLTDRQTKVLGLLVRGRDNRRIADELAVSTGTVKNDMAEIFEKLGVDNRAQAAVVAVRAGLL